VLAPLPGTRVARTSLPHLRLPSAPRRPSRSAGFFYVKKKNPKTLPGKMAFVKFDPVANRHAVFNEQKLR